MLKRFSIKGLFGTIDSEIKFNKEKITVIIGENGCGKTTILKIIAYILGNNHGRLFDYSFDYVEI